MSENNEIDGSTEPKAIEVNLDETSELIIDKRQQRIEKIKSEVKSIILIVVVVFSFRSVFFEPFRIPTGSMIPTLMIGDFILVNKFAYGFKVPFSEMFTPIYLFGEEQPKRGDVIVFKFPKDTSMNYIKRLIGLPGDTIEIRDKVVYVNGEALGVSEFDGNEIMQDMDDKFKEYRLKFYKSRTGEHEHIIQQHADSNYRNDYEKRVIPEGMYFVMGDNRDFSFDSRFWGFVPHENIKGKAIAVWFSMIFPFGQNQFKFRPHRIGTLID